MYGHVKKVMTEICSWATQVVTERVLSLSSGLFPSSLRFSK